MTFVEAETGQSWHSRDREAVQDSLPSGPGPQQQVGQDQEVYEYVDKVLKFLSTKPEAIKYRDMCGELEEIGARAQARIEKELRKRVAPQSSSPAKESGNPLKG